MRLYIAMPQPKNRFRVVGRVALGLCNVAVPPGTGLVTTLQPLFCPCFRL